MYTLHYDCLGLYLAAFLDLAFVHFKITNYNNWKPDLSPTIKLSIQKTVYEGIHKADRKEPMREARSPINTE